MDIIIIGGGPAGLMCATQASKNKLNNITLVDSNEKLGKKLYITGKGRCNVTNFCNSQDFLKNVVSNPKFLFSAINNFAPQDTIDFFNSNGLALKVERGNRVFPQSDKASDVTKIFANILKKSNVNILLNSKVEKVYKKDDNFFVQIANSLLQCDALVIATGGKSYPQTGSCGDGYQFAKTFSHQIVPIKPALCPIILKDYNKNLAGLTLKNVAVCVRIGDKSFRQFGEMLFTHTGVSGPIILSLSSYINSYDIHNCILSIDLKPSLTYEQLDNRLQRDFMSESKKSLKNYLKELLPSSLIDEFITKLQIDGYQQLNKINKEVRIKIVNLLKNFEFTIDKLEKIDYAIVTSGGVDTKEINPKNMQSKIVKNLFFIGEVLDLDALTGGFNIQIALSTGYACGNYLAQN